MCSKAKWLILLAALLFVNLIQCTPDGGANSTLNEITYEAYLSKCPSLNSKAKIRVEFFIPENIAEDLFMQGSDKIKTKVESEYSIDYIGPPYAAILTNVIEPHYLEKVSDRIILEFEFNPISEGRWFVSAFTNYTFYDQEMRIVNSDVGTGKDISFWFDITKNGCEILEGSYEIEIGSLTD